MPRPAPLRRALGISATTLTDSLPRWCTQQERYPDLMISVQRLPPKKFLGSLDPALIAMRQKSLDAYLQSVLVSCPANSVPVQQRPTKLQMHESQACLGRSLIRH